MSQDIVCLYENTKGRDFVIGDVHGNRDCLAQVIASLGNDDRLFIVGDLTDRGHDSPGVINLMLQHQDKVFSIRGNHEDQCLTAITRLENYALGGSDLFKTPQLGAILTSNRSRNLILSSLNDANKYNQYEKIKFELKNGRAWLIGLFAAEFKNQLITISENGLTYTENSQIAQIKAYMSKLPYIIHIPGQNPLNVVHADMPFDNSELIRRIGEGNYQLTAEERTHATWARGDTKKPFHQQNNPEIAITYVGHNIIQKDGIPIVRQESNIVNIDVAAYRNNASLVVNHTEKSSTFIGIGEPPEKLLSKKGELDNYLISRRQNLPDQRGDIESEDDFNFDLNLEEELLAAIENNPVVPEKKGQKRPSSEVVNNTNGFFATVKRRKLKAEEFVHIAVNQEGEVVEPDNDTKEENPLLGQEIAI